MPVVLLGKNDAIRFDVVGKHHPNAGVILHVGLVARSVSLECGTNVRVHDMGPPLNIDPPSEFPATVHGSLPLTRDEQEDIEEWLASILPLVSSCKYLALPAARLHRDEISNQIAYWEFSCAGFVTSAYELGAGIKFIDQSNLPPLDLGQAYLLWGGELRLPVFTRYAAAFGLKGNGPWPVLVPGHVLHALKYPRATLPYSPSSTDIFFP